MHEQYILSDNPVDMLSIEKNFFQTDIVQGTTF